MSRRVSVEERKRRNAAKVKPGGPESGVGSGFKPATSSMARYRDEMTRILISQLNEVDKETGKELKWLLIERLLALGIGLAIRGKGGKILYDADRPSLPAMKEIFDRLIGKPQQAVSFEGGDGKGGGRVTLVFDAPGDADL